MTGLVTGDGLAIRAGPVFQAITGGFQGISAHVRNRIVDLNGVVVESDIEIPGEFRLPGKAEGIGISLFFLKIRVAAAFEISRVKRVCFKNADLVWRQPLGNAYSR